MNGPKILKIWNNMMQKMFHNITVRKNLMGYYTNGRRNCTELRNCWCTYASWKMDRNMLDRIFLFFFSQTICIRQAQGYCCVQYQLCADQTNPFTIDRTLIAADVIKGLVDSSCILDYVAIPGSFSEWNTHITPNLL